MSRNLRPLIRPHVLAFAKAFAEARADLAQLNHEHQRELGELRRELDEVRALYVELRGLTLAREKADYEVAELRRLREIARAQATERDFATPLQ